MYHLTEAYLMAGLICVSLPLPRPAGRTAAELARRPIRNSSRGYRQPIFHRYLITRFSLHRRTIELCVPFNHFGQLDGRQFLHSVPKSEQ